MKKALFPTLLTVSLFTLVALAQEQSPLQIRNSSEIETSCRIKAKEVAAETYRGCVTDQKNAQIEQIKREYQVKMLALKAHYESELKKMAGKGSDKGAEKNQDKNTDKNSEQDLTAVPAETTEMKTENLTPEASTSSDAIQAEVIQMDEFKAEVVADPETGKMESTKTEKTEKTTKSQKTLPVKKQTQKSDGATKSPVTKKSVTMKKTVKVEKKSPFQGPTQNAAVNEMSVQLKPAPKGMIIDANGELPEPIPVESIQGSSI